MFPSLLSALLAIAVFCPTQGSTSEKPMVQDTQGGDPKAAFAALVEEFNAKKPQSQAEWEERKNEYIGMVRMKLSEFAKKFPDANEGYDARFQLAQMSADIDEKLGDAIAIVQACIKDLEAKPERKEIHAKALMLLARFQIADNHLVEARKNLNTLKEVLPSSPFSQAADSMLRQLDAMEKLSIGNPIIPFETKDLDGKKVSPKSFEGKVLLLDFWATWCGPCRKELPNVKAAYEENHAKGFEILAVSLDESEEKLRNFIKDQKMPWPQCFDGKGWQNEIAVLYGIKSIPATFLLDRSGKMRYKNLRGEELKTRIAELLAEETPAKK